MISRVWHGWTTPENADVYENLLKTEIIPGILAKSLSGFRRIELFRKERAEEVEFMTVMWFDDLDSVTSFVGEDHKEAYVPPAARAVLARFDRRSEHYDVRETRSPGD